MKLTSYSIIILIFFLGGCASSPSAQGGESRDTTPSDFISKSAHSVDGRLFIGPQPDERDLQNLKSEGIERVVNFRRSEEMAKLDFNEAEQLSALGIDYVQIPVGGKRHPYSPIQLQALTEVLQQDGKVLLHCGSGYRASIITVAYLVEVQGMPINEAISHAQGWWPLELENVLGEKLILQREAK